MDKYAKQNMRRVVDQLRCDDRITQFLFNSRNIEVIEQTELNHGQDIKTTVRIKSVDIVLEDQFPAETL